MGNTVVITCLLIYTFIFLNVRWCRCNGNSSTNSTLRCIPSERAALLNFKHNLTYFDKDVSASWQGEECCEWERVGCDNTTGHIRVLNLNGYQANYNDLLNFSGNRDNHLLKMKKLDSLVYLLELKQLERLDLSDNNFNYNSIPRFLGSMKQLRFLDLSSASLGGLVPSVLLNLTNLRLLRLSNNMLSGEIPAVIGELSNLEELNLSGNNLSSIASSLRFPSNLEHLDLSNNQLSGKIPTSIGKLSKLHSLDISSNLLQGTVLSEPHLAYLSSLTYLDMSDTMLTLNLSSDWVPPFQLYAFYANNCKINGQFPSWLQTSKNLTVLNLSNANISGIMPRWLHTMQQLDTLNLSNNKLSGSPVFPIYFSTIILSNNSFSGLLLSNSSKTKIYRHAKDIYLENNLIAGVLPKHFGNLMPNMKNLYLANNRIEGSIPNSLWQSTSLIVLDLQNNSLTWLNPNRWDNGQIMPTLQTLSLSNNQIKSRIPDSLCQLSSLGFLDILNNSLSGVIPNCLANMSSLYFVRLSYNKLTGHIPFFNNRDSNKFGPSEVYLHLNDNMLSGEIPSSLSGFINMRVLDIGGNQLSGKMLNWFIGESFKKLKILRLRGNKFSGPIPRQICSLPYLQLLDLGHNHFTGSIPRCFSNLTAMTSPYGFQEDFIDPHESISEVIQGIERAYTRTLPYLVDIDLSSNNLVGSIPDDMTKISGLLNLNLSYNQLSRTIPVNIGGLKSLVALDLSNNKLGGSIPTSIGELYRLSRLNLSYNNLSGPIPTGNQLQTLSDQASIYVGNPHLCGDLLPKKCKSKVDGQDKGRSNKGKGNNKEMLEKLELGVVVMSGFATGFWGVVGGLVLNRRWRHAVFRRVEDGYNWLYVVVAVRVAKTRRINRR